MRIPPVRPAPGETGRFIALIPVGATEQHGPHLPLDTDSRLVERLVGRAADRLDDIPIMVMPTLAFGYSVHHEPFGMTSTLSAETFMAALTEVCESVLRTSNAAVFIVNGHGGNADIVHAVAKTVAVEYRDLVAAGSYWKMAAPELAEVEGLPARIPGHAGAFETAMMLASFPELVSDSLPEAAWDPELHDPAGFTIDGPTRRIRRAGRTDDPRAASLELGRECTEAVISGVSRCLSRFWDEIQPETPSASSSRTA